MSERKYYCFCSSNCKFETMTKEQILAAIAQATGVADIDPDAAFISKVKETNTGKYVTFWVGTQAEYNALPSIESHCLYIITDDTTTADLARAMEEVMEKADAAFAIAQSGIAPSVTRLEAGDDVFANMFSSDADFMEFIESKAAELELYQQKTCSVVLNYEPFNSYALVTISKGVSTSGYITHVSVLTQEQHFVRSYYDGLGWGIWKAVNGTNYVKSVYTNGIWRVREWSNGECELWATVDATANLTSWGGVVFTENAIPAQDYPVTFANAPTVIATPQMVTEYCYGLLSGTQAGTTTASPAFSVWRANAASAAIEVRVDLYVKGTIA